MAPLALTIPAEATVGDFETSPSTTPSSVLEEPWSPVEVCRRCSQPAERSFSVVSDAFSRLRFCVKCVDAVTLQCGNCQKRLVAPHDEKWMSGLCDSCHACLPQCKRCAKGLRVNELKFKTGLCDSCWNSSVKRCSQCQGELPLGQIGWCTGLCNACYDAGKEACRLCCKKIRVDELGWRTGLCNECFDKKGGCQSKVSKKGQRMGLCHGCFQHCKKECMRCQEVIPDAELRWSSGLCDMCFKDCRRFCEDCHERIPMKQLRWGSGLCDACYHKRPQICRMAHCRAMLNGSDTDYHGVRLCSDCFKNCLDSEKSCTKCNAPGLLIGDPYWGIGLCDHCYKGSRRRSLSESMGFYAQPEQDLRRDPMLIYDIKSRALQPHRQATPSMECAAFLNTPGVKELLFTLVGISGWFAFNSMFAMLPAFVSVQGNSVVSLTSASAQLGALFAMSYHMWRGKKEKEAAQREKHWRVTEKRAAFNKERREKLALTRAKRAVHCSQFLACIGLLLFGCLWQWQKGVPAWWTYFLLGSMAGLVGNMSDLTVYNLAMQHPSSCAIALQFGGCLSGMLSFANSAFIHAGTVGVTTFFVIAAGLQLCLWWVICLRNIGGWPDLSDLSGRYEELYERTFTSCCCAGCPGCDFASGSFSRFSFGGSSGNLSMPLLRIHSDEITAEGETRLVSAPPLKHQFSLEALKAELFGSCSADPEQTADASLFAWRLSLGSLLARAIAYGAPNLFPFVTAAYVEQVQIYNNCNRMMNFGQIVGVAFFVALPNYTPKESHIWAAFYTCTSLFMLLCVCSIFPGLTASVLPEIVGAVLIPILVAILQICTRFFFAGSLKKVHEEAQAGRVATTLSAKLAFYGQIGCVGGNLLMCAIIGVFS
eukprot:TRINITY_DN33256_c0_g1_i1.p1 TRINITY_DN33256_c0_g1~~TRINITY_DN33256_c0_g1_i1.p1  ORF type:complete len:877 (-),score=148.17 TRINITY_DN33256_c0_g1_i1:120-2750(-)